MSFVADHEGYASKERRVSAENPRERLWRGNHDADIVKFPNLITRWDGTAIGGACRYSHSIQALNQSLAQLGCKRTKRYEQNAHGGGNLSCMRVQQCLAQRGLARSGRHLERERL